MLRIGLVTVMRRVEVARMAVSSPVSWALLRGGVALPLSGQFRGGAALSLEWAVQGRCAFLEWATQGIDPFAGLWGHAPRAFCILAGLWGVVETRTAALGQAPGSSPETHLGLTLHSSKLGGELDTTESWRTCRANAGCR